MEKQQSAHNDYRILQNIIESLPTRIFWKDRDSRFIGCNTLFARDAGFSYPEQLIGKTDFEMIWKEHADLYRHDDLKVMESGIPKLNYEEPKITQEGKTICIRTSKVPFRDSSNQIVGVIGIYNDITEQKLIEALLAKRESQLKEAQQIAQIGSWELDLVSGHLEWSDEIHHMFELPATQFDASYDAFLNAIHPDDREIVNRVYKESVAKQIPYQITHRLLMPEGQIKYVHEKGHTVYAKDGAPLRSIGTVQDVTERKVAENRLKLHSEILLHVREGVQMTKAEDEKIVYSTPTFDHMFGYAPGELIGKHISILDASSNQFVQTIQESLNKTGGWSGEVHHLKKDGSSFYCWVNISTFEHEEFGSVWISVHEDITQRKSVEKELHFANGIANRELIVREIHHRIKNNLQGITGVLRQFAERHPEIASPINQAISQVQSIAVIHGLQGRASLAQVRLCELTCAVASGVMSLWQKSVSVDIPSNWMPCIIDEAEAVPLALIINELISNAVKHSENSRMICITLSHEPLPDNIRVTILNAGSLPPNFDYDNKIPSTTGLGLVASLLPRTGAKLSWKQDSSNVVTILELEPPVITLESESSRSS